MGGSKPGRNYVCYMPVGHLSQPHFIANGPTTNHQPRNPQILWITLCTSTGTTRQSLVWRGLQRAACEIGNAMCGRKKDQKSGGGKPLLRVNGAVASHTAANWTKKITRQLPGTNVSTLINWLCSATTNDKPVNPQILWITLCNSAGTTRQSLVWRGLQRAASETGSAIGSLKKKRQKSGGGKQTWQIGHARKQPTGPGLQQSSARFRLRAIGPHGGAGGHSSGDADGGIFDH
jgi:hypothetical protein